MPKVPLEAGDDIPEILDPPSVRDRPHLTCVARCSSDHYISYAKCLSNVGHYHWVGQNSPGSCLQYYGLRLGLSLIHRAGHRRLRMSMSQIELSSLGSSQTIAP